MTCNPNGARWENKVLAANLWSPPTASTGWRVEEIKGENNKFPRNRYPFLSYTLRFGKKGLKTKESNGMSSQSKKWTLTI